MFEFEEMTEAYEKIVIEGVNLVSEFAEGFFELVFVGE
jgi:hypothetical protein